MDTRGRRDEHHRQTPVTVLGEGTDAGLHWSQPDIARDILREAYRPGVDAPVAVHIRRNMLARLRSAAPTAGSGAGPARRPIPLPLLVDDEIPLAPGFEVHRACPPDPSC